MRKLIAYTLLLIFGGIFTARGQVITDKEVSEQLDEYFLQMDKMNNKNLSFIHQVGSENEISAIQEQEGIITNIVTIKQDGTGNAGYMEQTGSELETHLWQYGLSNEANLWSVGNNINTNVKQDGEWNIINSYIENDGLNTRSAMLLQEGNGNKINLALLGDGFGSSNIAQEVIINQFGNEHEVKAFVEPFSSPVEINQYPGPGGEGMKIDISTSDFNFPMKK
jgi:hypothetical protein